METHTLTTGEVDLVYDVRGPLPPADGRALLLMIGQPMDAGGFAALADRFTDRTVVTYDPRGLGRSVRHDGRTENDPHVQAGDVHAVIEALGGGPVDLFASSGGAVTALALVAAHPGDVAVLVAHEPPLRRVLPDAEAARRAMTQVDQAYDAHGFGAGMAGFITLTSWPGEFTDEYFARPAPDPVAFGLPSEDDGSRDSPLLSAASRTVGEMVPDVAALTAAPTRIVVAAGEQSHTVYPGRAAYGLAELLGSTVTLFPSHHGGFLPADSGYPGEPDAFARTLRTAFGM